MNKKAVSPLIAAVLLIVVVVGVGAVITSVARTYVQQSQDQTVKSVGATKCATDLDLRFAVVQEEFFVCKNSTHLNFMIENLAGEIKDFQVKIFTNTLTETNESLGESMAQGESKFFKVPYYTVSENDIVEFWVIPTIKDAAGRRAYCSDVSLKANGIKAC
ncbi:hypothetical protein ACFL0V_03670 [Nanoarchaeota archaeon]